MEEEVSYEEISEPEMGVTSCENPFCPDVSADRPVPLGIDYYWCGTCGVRMAPPEEPTPADT